MNAPTCMCCELQMALAHAHHSAAAAALEQALSCDFRVRSSPLYLLLRGQVQSHSGALEEARTTFEDALRLPGVRDGSAAAIDITGQDRCAQSCLLFVCTLISLALCLMQMCCTTNRFACLRILHWHMRRIGLLGRAGKMTLEVRQG